MNVMFATWLFFRALRWAFWIAFLGYCFFVFVNKETQVNSYGHLPLETETLIYALGLGTVFAGFLELMMREKAGLARPKFGRLIPPSATAQSN